MNIKYKSDLDTPCLVLDIDILEQNLRIMQMLISKAGKNLRPHVKTHKCSILAQKQIENGAVGVCVAKLSEAEMLVKTGIQNILITGPIVTKNKVKKLVELVAINPELMVVLDNQDIADMLNQELRFAGINMRVILDIDVGQQRTGVNPADASKLAEHISSCSNLTLKGIQAYAGHLQHIPVFDARKQSSLGSLQDAVAVFNEIKSTIPTCDIFSASGTGTSQIDIEIPELTELQTGSYVCMDAEYLAIEKSTFAPALRLLTTVISTNQREFVTVDAGLKTLYRDGAVPRVFLPENSGLIYDWYGDEYGKISHKEPDKLPAIGDVLELIVSHCDPTINLFDKYFITHGDQIVDIWNIDLRGCSQ